MALFGFGTAAVDFRVSTADLGVEYKDKLLARTVMALGGGATANSLCQAARLGSDAQWLGKIGTDPVGVQILNDLAASGVRTEHVIAVDGALSPFNVAVYAGPTNRRVGGFLLANSLSELTTDEANSLGEVPGPGDWCLVEIGEVPLEMVLAFCKRAAHRGASLVLDVDLDPVAQCVDGSIKLIQSVFQYADFILPNVAAIRSLYDSDDPAEIVRAVSRDTGKPAVVTAGAAGSFFSTDGFTVDHVAAFPVDVIDTVGAGDAFHGSFLWALSRAESLRTAVEIASVCGAANCTAFGARSGMLDRDALELTRKDGRRT